MNYFLRISAIIAYLLICSGIMCAGYYFDISPLENKLTDAKQKNEALKSQLSSMGYQQILLEEKLARLPEIESMLKTWQDRFIKSDDLDKLSKEIYRLGKAHQLQFDLFDTQVQQMNQYYHYSPVKLVVVGSYAQLSAFIAEIAKLPWLVTVGDFNLDQQMLRASISLVIYQV